MSEKPGFGWRREMTELTEKDWRDEVRELSPSNRFGRPCRYSKEQDERIMFCSTENLSWTKLASQLWPKWYPSEPPVSTSALKQRYYKLRNKERKANE